MHLLSANVFLIDDCLKAFRAQRGSNAKAVVHLLHKVPMLKQYFTEDGTQFVDYDSFANMIAELMRNQLDQDRNCAMSEASSSSQKSSKLESVRRMSSLWRKSGRMAGITSVLLEQAWGPGAALTGTVDLAEQAAAHLAQHWSRVFAEQKSEEEAAKEILEHAPKDCHQNDWEVSERMLQGVMSSPKQSAPGPDGIPYKAYASVAPLASKLLGDVASLLQEDHSIVDDTFNEAFMVFIAKGDHGDDDETTCIRTPSTTRPLTLSNTDTKLISAAINRPLSAYASSVVAGQQRGFIKGRSISDNIVELEAQSLVWAGRHCVPHALVSFDIAAAFPSLNHHYLWAVLQHYNIPNHIISLIKSLYYKHTVKMKLMGRHFKGFPIEAGIKQGCPCSGTLFALALDPFIRMLCNKIPRSVAVVCAFADDMAMALMDFFKMFPLVAHAFFILSRAAALDVNTAKTQLVPITGIDPEELKRYLRTLTPTTSNYHYHYNIDEFTGMVWHNVKISDKMLYLGALVGPGAYDAYWLASISKMKAAALRLSALGLPWQSALRWLNIAVGSIPHYCLQLQPPSAELIKTHSIVVSKVAGLPHQSIPLAAWHHLPSLGMDFWVTSLDAVGWASKYRMVARSELARDYIQQIELLPLDDDALAVFPLKQWLSQSHIKALDKAHQHVIAWDVSAIDDQAAKLQSHIYKLALQHQHNPLPALLQRRLAPQLHLPLSDEDLQEWLQALPAQLRKVPGFLQVSFVRGLCVAWNTSARYGRKDQRCLWCGLKGGDAQAHYLTCTSMLSVLQVMAPSIFEIWIDFPTLLFLPWLRQQAYGIGGGDIHSLCIVHDLAHSAYNSSKHGRVNTIENAFRARARVIARHSASSKDVLTSMFSFRADVLEE